jgi:hypothetical protein
MMLFGYDADVAPEIGTNLIRIRDLARSLLGHLANKRQDDQVGRVRPKGRSIVANFIVILQELHRPLIFIGHSLGGLVIKKVCPAVIVAGWYYTILDLLSSDYHRLSS